MHANARSESPRPLDPQRAGLIAALGVALFLGSWITLHFGFYARHQLPDTPLYEQYGDAMVKGGLVPYRDFPMVYPPAALPVFAVPSLVAARGDYPRYRRVFEALMAACGAAAVWFVASTLARLGTAPARLAAALALIALAPLMLGSLILSHFDLWPAMLSVAALAALAAGRERLGCGVLGLAVAAKLYPVVLVPIALAYAWRRRGRRRALSCAGVMVAVAATCFVPFFALAPHAVWLSVTDQWRRPLQIESLGASFLLAAHQAFGTSVTVITTYGSQNLYGSGPDALESLQAALELVILIGVWTVFALRRPSPARLLWASAAALGAAVALGKVLSPQFMIWLVPLVPLVRGRRGLAAGALFGLAMVLTQLWFPYRYPKLAFGLDPTASWLVFVRDLLLVAMLAVLLWPRRRQAAAASMTGRGERVAASVRARR